MTSLAGKCVRMRPHFPSAEPRTASETCRKMVSLLSSVMTMMRLPISCTSSISCWLHDPVVSMATGKNMCRLKSLILCSLVFCWLFGCLFACSGAQMGLGESIRNSDVPTPKPLVSFWPRVLELLRLGVCHHFWGGLLDSWDLCPFNGPPYMMSFIWLWRCCLGSIDPEG